jgi:hypothetical protein
VRVRARRPRARGGGGRASGLQGGGGLHLMMRHCSAPDISVLRSELNALAGSFIFAEEGEREDAGDAMHMRKKTRAAACCTAVLVLLCVTECDGYSPFYLKKQRMHGGDIVRRSLSNCYGV